MKKQIVRFCWPESFRKSGVWNFSNPYIKELKSRWCDIFDKWIKVKNNYIRLLVQFLIYPLQAITKYRNNKKIFRDEWMLLYTLSPLFPYNNSIFIVHDIRNFDNSAKEKTFLQRIYFHLIEKSLKNLNKVECIITPSEFTKDKIIDKFWINWEKINVIYSPLDLTIYKQIPWIDKKSFLKKYWIKTDKKILLNIWSEESRKNIMTILKAMKELNDYVFIKIWRPIIEQNRKEHLKFINSNKLRDKVFFIDFVETNEDLVRFYNIANIFMFPSLFEWFWRPPIEAQACWCPVISSDKGGLKEVLWDSAIILHNPQEQKEVISKIKLLNEKSLQEKYIALWFKNVSKFDISNNIQKILKIIN